MKVFFPMFVAMFGACFAVASAQSGATAQLPPPVLRCSFSQDTQGGCIRDASGYRNDGVVVGKLQAIEGIGNKGRAVHFDGQGTFVRVPRSESLEPKAITVAVWIRIEDDSNREEPGVVVFKRNTSYYDNEDYALQVMQNHVLRIDASSPHGGHYKVDSAVALAPGLWHHAAMAINGRGARLYLDGELVGERVFPCVLDHYNGADLLIGARDHAALPTSWFGEYDLAELQIWGAALDRNQIARLYRKHARFPGVAKPENNLPPDFPPERPGGGVGKSRVFPAWTSPAAQSSPNGARILAELRELLLQGRRDRAASPEYLNALQRLIDRHSVPQCPTECGEE